MRTSAPSSPGRSLLTALAGLTAYREGEHAMVLELGSDPRAFAGAVAVAAVLADELKRAGRDPAEILARVYARASGMPS